MSPLFTSGTSSRTAHRTLARELEALYGPEEARALAWQALEHVLQVPRINLLTRNDLPLQPQHLQQLGEVAARLLRHEPIQYITGWVEFCDLELQVGPGVLIPRPETEELAYYIISKHKHQRGLRVLDMGTGSGCLALALAKHLPEAQVQAIDFSGAALAIAAANAERLQLPVSFKKANVLALQPGDLQPPYDLVVSNPPYVLQSEEEQMLPNVLQHEPHTALFVPDTDPLLFYRAITQLAAQHLQPGGWLYFETNERFADEVAQQMQQQGFRNAVALPDLFGKPRFAEGQRQ